eukprot:XP_011662559.1 PREDICTED: protein IWS1 homolog A [Strongylocentrotus purpuratus]
MRVMEHWAHRRFPKMLFDDVIERIEKLGSKKPVQTCIRKIRLDMPLLDEDFVTRGEDVIEGEDGEAATGLGDDFPAPSFPGTQQPPSTINTPKVSMSDEQRERIELNKKLAMERRLNKQKEAKSSQKPAASQSDGLNEAEIHDLFGTGKAKTRVEDDDGIDSDEDEMEREMWESQMTGGTKDKKASQKGAASGEVEIDADEAEMENEMWNQMTQPVSTQSQMSRSQETTPKVAKKSNKNEGIIEDESDAEEMKTAKDSQFVGSQDEAPKRGRRNKRVIDDDSDDDDDVMEMVKDSQTAASQVMQSKGAKKRRVIEDDESDDEMEAEDSNKMTELLSPKPPKDGPEETSASRSLTGSQKSVRIDGEEEPDVVAEEDDDDKKKDPQNAEVENDICNQMTEPVLSHKPTDPNSLLTSQETSNSNSLDEVINDDDSGEIWNQMTEQVKTQIVNDSQADDQSYNVLKSKKRVIEDDDDDDDETQIDLDMCNQETEPVNTGNSQDTVET